MRLVFRSDTATTVIYTLSLHDALPIFTTYHNWNANLTHVRGNTTLHYGGENRFALRGNSLGRSEEHTSRLQSLTKLVCRHLAKNKSFLIPSTSPGRRLD